MAQITLAQALKEKNRLAGELSRLWGLFQARELVPGEPHEVD